jgi:hypothetical protein
VHFKSNEERDGFCVEVSVLAACADYLLGISRIRGISLMDNLKPSCFNR